MQGETIEQFEAAINLTLKRVIQELESLRLFYLAADNESKASGVLTAREVIKNLTIEEIEVGN